METCRSCHKPIIWAITNKGRRNPIDPEPVADGNITLQDQGKYRPPLATVHTVKPQGVPLYKSHFATCRDSKSWRKKR